MHVFLSLDRYRLVKQLLLNFLLSLTAELWQKCKKNTYWIFSISFTLLLLFGVAGVSWVVGLVFSWLVIFRKSRMLLVDFMWRFFKMCNEIAPSQFAMLHKSSPSMFSSETGNGILQNLIHNNNNLSYLYILYIMSK